MLRYRPSNNALAAYSPLRQDLSRQSNHHGSVIIGQNNNRDSVAISREELGNLRSII